MDEPVWKQPGVGREEWARRVERWRESGLTAAEFAAELGVRPKSLANWAWTLKREASGKKRVRPAKHRKQLAAQKAPAASTADGARSTFVEVKGHAPQARFELEVRGRRLHIPPSFDAQQLRSLLEILETA